MLMNMGYSNDERENSRHDLVLYIYSMLFGGTLIFSPIKSPKNILDIGTGTGSWAMEVAEYVL